MTSRRELIERLEKLDGPDREVDEALMAMFYVRDERHIGTSEGYEDDEDRFVSVKDDVWVDPATDKWVSTAPDHFTRSIDAAVALVQKVLPGREYSVRANIPGLDWCIATVRTGPLQSTAGECSTPAISLVVALLRALEAQESR